MERIRNSPYPRVILILLIFLLVLIPVSIFAFGFFRIKKVLIISTRQDLNGLSILNSQNLLTIQTDKLEKDLENKNGEVKRIIVTKKYPDSLVITVSDRIGRALAVGENGSKLIDEDGYILSLPPSGSIDYPKIRVPTQLLTVGRKADWRLIKAVDLISESANQNITVTKISIDDTKGVYQLETDTETLVTILLSDNPIRIVTSLQLILSRFRIEGKNVSSVDFQFDKPVVTLKNTSNR